MYWFKWRCHANDAGELYRVIVIQQQLLKSSDFHGVIQKVSMAFILRHNIILYISHPFAHLYKWHGATRYTTRRWKVGTKGKFLQRFKKKRAESDPNGAFSDRIGIHRIPEAVLSPQTIE